MRVRLLIAGAGFALAAASASAQMVDTPVLARPIEKGALLSPTDFAVEAMTAISARGAVGPDQAAGMEAARRLGAGMIVRAGDLARPQLVRRGAPVQLSVRSGALTITAPGRALSGGAAGDLVRVVSTATSRTIDGVVEADGRVRVASN